MFLLSSSSSPSGPVCSHCQYLCCRAQQVHVLLLRSLSGKLMSGNRYKTCTVYCRRYSSSICRFFLLYQCCLLFLLSGSVESILLHRHPDSRLCGRGGLLLRYSTWRCTNFYLVSFSPKLHTSLTLIWPLCTQTVMWGSVKYLWLIKTIHLQCFIFIFGYLISPLLVCLHQACSSA